jgi:hypothetical protein
LPAGSNPAGEIDFVGDDQNGGRFHEQLPFLLQAI